METISGFTAISLIRRTVGTPDNDTFGLLFITYDKNRPQASCLVRQYHNCRLRTPPHSEAQDTHPDFYLYFTADDKPLQCWRHLIRQVRIGNTWYRVNWFPSDNQP